MFGLIIFFWAALHISQSAIDLADFLLIALALKMAYQNGDLRQNLWLSFKPAVLWPLWIGVVISGFLFGATIASATAIRLVWEFRWFVSFLCLIYVFKRVEWNENQQRSLALVLFAISILDLVLFFVDYDRDPRAGGLFHHSMPFAHTIGPSALLLLFLGLKKAMDRVQPLLWRVVYFGAPVLGSIMVVLSFTRGIWLGFTLALLGCTFFLGRKVFLSSIGALVLIGVILFAGSERIQTRVMGKTNAESQSNNERLLYWKANFQIFKDYPAVGIGYSQNNVHVEEYLKKDGVDWLTGAHAHNQYIHFLAGTGALGLLCFLTFLAAIFYPLGMKLLELRKSRRFTDTFYLLLGSFAALLCFVIGSLTESNFSIAKNRFVFLFIAALAYAMTTFQNKKPSKK